MTGPAAQLGLQMNAGARILLQRAQRAGRRSTATRSSCASSTTATSPTAARPTPRSSSRTTCSAVRLRGHADLPGRAADGRRREDPVLRPVHRRRGAARPVPQDRVPPARLVLRRDRADREAAHVARAEEDRGLLPERCLRQGRPRRRDARAEGAQPRAGGARHGRAQHGQRGARRARTSRRRCPNAVVQISAYKSCAAFIRAARKAGYGGTFFNVSFVGTQALADELGKEGQWRDGQPGDAVPVLDHDSGSRASTSTRCARPAATRGRTTRAWRATWLPRCWPRA